MKLTVIGSSSSGNCYVIQSDTEAIILEAGIGLDKAKKVLGFNVSKVNACLITHAHGDHAGKAADYEKTFPTYTLEHVIEAKGLKRSTAVYPMKKFTAGRFTILPFRAQHDVPCVGYLISHPDIGKLMFLTDSFLCEYSFKGVNHILVECNYSDKALQEAIDAGKTHAAMRTRLMTTHMELRTCCKVINNQDLSDVHNIVLLHLSMHNSDRTEMLTTVKQLTGQSVTIATPGLEFEISNNPF
ncbi:MBL fold metallo-hydrolase [Bacteroides neonati]|uniref:MBL fold metallo-hydrolase n=1 Tax=Bacteroides neonati TaxID=1347393 RepID=UPI0004AF34EE|nr:MBL fold metallo-hydrolase [Bacteroides neonati]